MKNGKVVGDLKGLTPAENEQEEGYVEPDYSEFLILFYIDESTNENVKCYEAKLINIQGASLIRREDL